MKLGESHYDCKSIPESGSSSSFGDMTSQNLPRKKGTSHHIWLFIPGKRVKLLKMSFYVQNRSSRLKVDPHVNLSKFQAEENFFILYIFEIPR